ncbi:NAD(P)-dependent oxidoreductase [Taibaiella soli]|uniref:NAD(P)-dependent oxidoreductase n=1 Tax=Taibaiella soli TaxID=1649169 RepID=A0A2W2B7Q7_9BACT|nr:NAD(P)-dependent oxidoreductase [Taibaiella soli]PZF72299.1 NAD(P)-dependent oxidoreductase [Taibaiella soli]
MKVALIGASGFVGSALLSELQRRGHEITAITRHPENVKSLPDVAAVKADVFNEDELANALKGNDAIISAYNPGWTNPNIYEDFMKGARSIENAAKKSGVSRIIIIGGAGSLEIAPGVQLVDTPQFPAEYKQGALGARDYLAHIRNEENLDWTFFSPAILMNPAITEGRTGRYRTGRDNPVFDEKGESRLSVEDLSVAIVDALEKNTFIKQRFTAAY